MLIKLLTVLAAFGVAYLLWVRSRARKAPSAQKRQVEDLVQCRTCGAYRRAHETCDCSSSPTP